MLHESPTDCASLGVLEWSYVVPEKPFFKNRVWFGVNPSPPQFGESPDFFVDFFCETFPYFVSYYFPVGSRRGVGHRSSQALGLLKLVDSIC